MMSGPAMSQILTLDSKQLQVAESAMRLRPGSSLFRVARSTIRAATAAARSEFTFQYRIAPRTPRERLIAVDFPVAGRYILSSERGIYHVSANVLRKLSSIPAFGIAIAG